MFANKFKKKQYYKKSYSQLGEDVIINFIFEQHGITLPTYIDIGAHDPMYLSNTALFYEKGCSGINIEPNPILWSNINKVRKKDINLNCGVGTDNNPLDFYIMNVPTMSTFSKENADELVSEHKFEIVDVKKIAVHSLDYLLEKYTNNIFPDFLSLDAEGLDFDILKTIDYEKTAPKVICVETIEYSRDMSGRKEKEIIDFLVSQGYRIFADTYVNTIFEKF